MTPPTIDIHSHFVPPVWNDLSERFGTSQWPWLKRGKDGQGMIMLGSKPFRPISASCWDAAAKVEDMDRNSIDLQLICATPVMFAYDKPSDQAAYAARIYNDAALEICSKGHRRLRALCQVPLQDADAACRELDRAMLDGHVGVQIGNHVGARDLDDSALLTFLSHCAAVGAPVLVHPWDMLGIERMGVHMLPWLVGMPVETQLTILRLVLTGAFERLPKNLKLCFAHGGGSFAFLLGRAENAWHHHPAVSQRCPRPPSSYLNRFSVDSLVFDERTLKFLIEVMGEDRILLGSDYPFPLGENAVGSLVKNAVGLTVSAKAKILGINSRDFFNLQ